MASLIQRILSEAISFKLHDPRIQPWTTVSRVEITADLLVAKVYLTIQGDEAAERRTLTAVRHATGFLQRLVAGALSVRQCPELRFNMDERAKGTRRTMELLAKNRLEHPELYEDIEAADRVGVEETGAEERPSVPPESGEDV